MNVKDLSWKHVWIVGLVLAAVVGIQAMEKDTALIATIGLGLLIGIGLIVRQQGQTHEATQVVKEQTNGNISKVLEQNARLVDTVVQVLARAQPIDGLGPLQLPAAPAPPDVTQVLPVVGDPPQGN